jgi:hypothetical protein
MVDEKNKKKGKNISTINKGKIKDKKSFKSNVKRKINTVNNPKKKKNFKKKKSNH